MVFKRRFKKRFRRKRRPAFKRRFRRKMGPKYDGQQNIKIVNSVDVAVYSAITSLTGTANVIVNWGDATGTTGAN